MGLPHVIQKPRAKAAKWSAGGQKHTNKFEVRNWKLTGTTEEELITLVLENTAQGRVKYLKSTGF